MMAVLPGAVVGKVWRKWEGGPGEIGHTVKFPLCACRILKGD